MSLADLIKESGGAPSAKFDSVGVTVGGKVIAATVRQARNFDDGKPEVWEDGSPKQQAAITVQTDLRDPSIDRDNGERTIYVKWWGDQRRNFLDALRQAGADDVLEGGSFSCTYIGDGESQKRGFPPKLYQFTYSPPSALGNAVAAAAPQPAQPVATAPQPTAAPAPASAAPAAGGPDLAAARQQIAQLTQMGMSAEQIAGVPTIVAAGIDVATVQAIQNIG